MQELVQELVQDQVKELVQEQVQEPIKPSFVSEPEHKTLKLSELSEWTLPEIEEGSFALAAAKISFDS